MDVSKGTIETRPPAVKTKHFVFEMSEAGVLAQHVKRGNPPWTHLYGSIMSARPLLHVTRFLSYFMNTCVF